MSRRLLVVAAMALGMLLPAAGAQADTGNIIVPQHHPANETDGWQAGPCTSDTPVKCSPTTTDQFFRKAGGHPPKAFTQFTIQHNTIQQGVTEPLIEPLEGRVPRKLRADLPPGLSVNPNATGQKCTKAEFFHVGPAGNFAPICGASTVVGQAEVNVVTGEDGFLDFPKGSHFADGAFGLTVVQLFNLVPDPGEPALFGFVLAGSVRVLLKTELSWESDFHESFTIEELPDFGQIKFPEGFVLPLVILNARLTVLGRSGDGTLATNPTTCFNSDLPQFSHLYSSWLRMDSYEEPNFSFPSGSTPIESSPPPGIHPEGCENIPFDPTIEVAAGTSRVDSPAAPTVRASQRVEFPTAGGKIAESHLRSAKVTLPEGMTLNPAGSVGLQACTDAQFHKGDRTLSNSCPAASVLGTARINTPVLDELIEGKVYLGQPKSSDPASGEEFRLLVEAKIAERGVVVRLIGNVKADPKTGQLTAVFDEQETSPLFGALPKGLPQLPLQSITLQFDGPHQVLSTPPTCAPATAIADMEPWARPGTHLFPRSTMNFTTGANGGACPQTLFDRPFAPASTVAPDSPQGGAFTPFRIHIRRSDGEEEIKRISATLPVGLIAKLAGIPYCPEAAIAAAAGRSGIAERTTPSCPASQVGSTSTQAGTGGQPLTLPGKVYLAGPYQGAPLSLVAITPGISGPFDLGTVVIRVALNLDPNSAQITASSDLIPDVFGGVRLDIRAIDLNLDRKEFTLNPTNCAAQATVGAILSGGADPTDPASFGGAGLNAPFAPTGCAALNFGPTLTTEIAGPTKRGGYPRLNATLVGHAGDANIASASVTLPHAFFVAQEHIGTLCTRPQLAALQCPAASAYGHAEAASPLLDRKLSGPVYLVPGGHTLPDLVADLSGQVNIQVHGVIDSQSGKIKATFDAIPDLPVSEFSLAMEGGKKGLIVNSANICKSKPLGALDIEGQNGKSVKSSKYKLKYANCKPRKKHKKHRKHKH